VSPPWARCWWAAAATGWCLARKTTSGSDSPARWHRRSPATPGGSLEGVAEVDAGAGGGIEAAALGFSVHVVSWVGREEGLDQVEPDAADETPVRHTAAVLPGKAHGHRGRSGRRRRLGVGRCIAWPRGRREAREVPGWHPTFRGRDRPRRQRQEGHAQETIPCPFHEPFLARTFWRAFAGCAGTAVFLSAAGLPRSSDSPRPDGRGRPRRRAQGPGGCRSWQYV
jgi:hypothetical protein